jgi:hypothetical protein
MNTLGGNMVSLDELFDHFVQRPDEVLGFIEALGTPEDIERARQVPFRKRVELLHALMADSLKVA